MDLVIFKVNSSPNQKLPETRFILHPVAKMNLNKTTDPVPHATLWIRQCVPVTYFIHHTKRHSKEFPVSLYFWKGINPFFPERRQKWEQMSRAQNGQSCCVW